MDRVKQRAKESLGQLLDRTCDDLSVVWSRIGMDEQYLVDTRLPVMVSWVTDLCEDLVRCEVNVELGMLDSVKAKLGTVLQLAAELGVEESLPPDSLSLMERDRRLTSRIAELKGLKVKLEMRATYEQMETIWRRLRLPEEEQRPFRDLLLLQLPTRDDQQKLETELRRLRGLVLPRLREYVRDCRTEIAALWDQCRVAPDERRRFAAFYSDDYSEELLVQHEQLLAGLQRKLQQHQRFLAVLRDWQDSWNSLQVLQKRLKDPAVLNNRGGILLRIEKERKRAQQVASAKEEQLMQLHAAGESLPINGQQLPHYVSSVKLKVEEEKENEAKQRLAKHETTLKKELRYGSKPASPLQRRVIFNSTSGHSAASKQPHQQHAMPKTPCSTPSRSVLRTPSSRADSGKVVKPQSKSGCSAKVKKQRSRRSSAMVAARKLLRNSLKQLRADSSLVVESPEPKPQTKPRAGDDSVSTSYSEFQLGVGPRSSTVLPACGVSGHDSGLSSLDHRL